MNYVPMLSVLVTFCNQKEYIKDCIDSILSQETNFSYEVLIAVDGEDDGSMELLKSYKHDNFSVWKVESDKNLLPVSRASSNRLFLLSKAAGKYFLTLDGDDFLVSNKRFETGISFLEKNKTYIGHLCHWCKFDDSTKSFIDEAPLNTMTVSLDSYIKSKSYIHISCGIFVNIFKNHKFPYKYFFDDPCIMFYMLKKGYAFFDNFVGFGYRVGKPSIFNGLSDDNKKILQVITYIKLLDITQYNKEILRRFLWWYRQCVNKNIHISENIKSQISYQRLLIPYSIIKYTSIHSNRKALKMYHKAKLTVIMFLYKILWQM